MTIFLDHVKGICGDFNPPAPGSAPLHKRGLGSWKEARALTAEEAEALRGVWMGAQVGDLILPTRNHTGQIVGARLWTMEGVRLAPRADSGLATTGAVLCNRVAANWLLRTSRAPNLLLIGEGEPDMAALCILAEKMMQAAPHVSVAVVGIYSGAWTADLGERAGEAINGVVIATDRDKAGEGYAGKIRASIKTGTVTRWLGGSGGEDVNDCFLKPDFDMGRALFGGAAMPPPPSDDEGRWAWTDAAGWAEDPSWAAAREAEKAWAAAREIPRERLDDALLERAKKWSEAKLAAVCLELEGLDGNRGRALAIMAPVMSLVAGGALDRGLVEGDLVAAYVSGDKETRRDRHQQVKDALKSGPNGRPRDPISLEDIASKLAAEDDERKREEEARRKRQEETKQQAPKESRKNAKNESKEATPPAGIGGDWEGALETKKGVLVNSVRNWMLLLDNDRSMGQIRYNKLAQRTEVFGKPAWISEKTDGIPLNDARMGELISFIGDRYKGATPGADLLLKATVSIAHRNAYDPVLEYLNGLKWDGKERLNTWLIDYCKTTSDEPSARLAGPWWMMSAVARILNPGCQADYSIVLEGAQGARKSSAVLALCPNPEWFLAFDYDPASKEALENLQGKWLVEMAELAVLSRGRDMRQIKSFITRRCDKYRAPYGMISEDRPRRCVFFGTVNPEGAGDYLSDPTGNRRWWPVMVVGSVDVAGLERDRDQLWAEALERVRAGERYYPETDAEFSTLSGALALRTSEDEWVVPVRKYLEFDAVDDLGNLYQEITSYQVLTGCLDIENGRISKADQMRLAIVLKLLGWQPAARSGGKRVWVRPSKPEPKQAPKQLNIQ